jgi:hypothetical protein
MTSIQSACDAPEQFKNRGRAVFLQPVAARVDLAGLRQLWTAAPAADGAWTFRGGSGFLSVTPDGGLVDLYPVDDGSGRQRWDRVSQPGGAVALRVHAGLNAGAPCWLTRLGNLKVCLRKAVTPQGLWRLSDPPPADAKPADAKPADAKQLAARDVLLARRGRPLALTRESPGFCMYADVDPDGRMPAVLAFMEKTWAAYLALGFAVRPSVTAAQGWEAFKKPVYLGGATPPGPCGGCPESGHGYEYQGWDDAGHAFLCTGGFGAEGGCVAHELGHLMQVGTGGFTWGGTCPWAWESAAQFMRWHGCPGEEDAESLKPWLKSHWASIERNEGDAAYHYGSWLWWVFLDAEFGAGTTGRVWSTAAAPESPLAACSRVAGVPLPDLFCRWVAAVLTQKYTATAQSARWARVNAAIGHSAGWATFDALAEPGEGRWAPAAQNLERGGFHALRLADGKARGPRKLRLDAPGAGFRAVVVVDGAARYWLRAGETTPEPVPVARTVLGISATDGTAGAAGPYAVSAVV